MHTDVQVPFSAECFFFFIWRFLEVGCLMHRLGHDSMHGRGLNGKEKQQLHPSALLIAVTCFALQQVRELV